MRSGRGRWIERLGLPEDEPAVDADAAWIGYVAEREARSATAMDAARATGRGGSRGFARAFRRLWQAVTRIARLPR
jgi:hypothetical protein